MFGKHWRGEYSLPRAYWVNGLLISLPLSLLVAVAAGFAAAVCYNTYGLGATNQDYANVGQVALLPVGVWAMVGILRSALRRGGFWGAVAIIVSLIGWIGNIAQAATQRPGWVLFSEIVAFLLCLMIVSSNPPKKRTVEP
jgi:hypothetical protein